jgi:proteasome lid subunit RPN8/RPN11
VKLPRSVAEAIERHARAEAPNEACGLVVGTADPDLGGKALRYEACRNELASPTRYRIAPEDVYRVAHATDLAGEAIWGIVHSHVRTPAEPSRTDIEAATWPSALYLLVALEVPQLRAWRIVHGERHEVPLEIVEG